MIRVGDGDTHLHWNVGTPPSHYTASLHRRQRTSSDIPDRCQNVLGTACQPQWGNITCTAVMCVYCMVLTCNRQNVIPIHCDSLFSRPDSLLVWYLACEWEGHRERAWHLEVDVLRVYCACMSLDTDIWKNVLISVALTIPVALEVIHHIAPILERLIWSVEVKLPSYIVVHKLGSIHSMYQ
jgi:hypothetical protein